MSVINKMLKDLEARKQHRASQPIAGVRATHVTTSVPSVFKRLLMIFLVIVIIIASAIFWLWQQLPQQQSSTMVPIVQPQNLETKKVAVIENQDELSRLMQLDLADRVVTFTSNQPLKYNVLPQKDRNLDIVLYGIATTETKKPLIVEKLEQNKFLTGLEIEQDQNDLIAHFKLKPDVELETLKDQDNEKNAKLEVVFKSTMTKESQQMLAKTVVTQKMPEPIAVTPMIKHASKKANKQLLLEKQYKRALAAYEAGAKQKALMLSQNILTRDSENLLATELIARILFNQKKYALALKQLNQIPQPELKADPEYYVLQANIYQEMNKPAIAARIYTKLTQLQPRNGTWWLGLAINLENTKRWNDARIAYSQAQAQSLDVEVQEYAEKRISVLQG